MFHKIVAGMFLFLLSVSSWAAPVWIDVRSLQEYESDHIEGDIRIAHTSIVKKLTVLYPSKDTELHLYCRSGGRAGKAKAALEAAGYTSVQNAGGIADARDQRGLLK